MRAKSATAGRKRMAFLLFLALALVVSTALVTVAWLTAEDSITNRFTVGNFAPPTDPGEKPTPDPGAGEVTDPNESLGGYIIEPSWDTTDEHKLVPGGDLYKDPYVGIGAGSEEAAVYVYVENPFGNNSVYFTLNTTAWEAVEGETVSANQGLNTYVSGLFHYTGGTGGILEADASKDVWTSDPVFTKVVVSDTATTEDLNTPAEKEITVSCFIHQVHDGNGSEIGADVIKQAAINAFTSEP